MISNEKIFNHRAIDRNGIYNFDIDHVNVWGYMIKKWILKYKI